MSDGTFEDALVAGEELLLSWTTSTVRWAGQWNDDPPTPTAFAATDRRLIFSNADGATSIGYDHVRAVETRDENGGPGAFYAFAGFGGLGLLAGLFVATRDPLNGFGLVGLSILLMAVGTFVNGATSESTVTVVIDNERQRLTFGADDDVATELRRLAD